MAQRISLNGGDWLFKGYVGEDWLLRKGHLPGTRDLRGWRAATVPGSVQHDLWQAGAIPDPYFEMNSLLSEWAPERTWLYKRTFNVPPDARGQRVRLVFQGVDYTARYYLNGEALGSSAGMFLPVTFDVSGRLNYDGENLLVVVIDPAPYEQPQIGYTSRVYTQKTRMNYWWDFAPRVVHLGIWQDVFLHVTGQAVIADVWVQPRLADDLQRAEVEVVVTLDKPAELSAQIEIRLNGGSANPLPGSQSLALGPGETQGRVTFQIDRPELWWPNGAGEQSLYTAAVTARLDGDESDTREVSFGIRRLEFVQNEGAAQGTLPYNLVANGRRLYIQGWNWVPIDVLYGVDRPEKLERLLRLAKGANVNLLRVWGGGLIEKESFYNLCDRLGILVWQEFIQSSSGVDNVPSEEPQFIRFLEENARAAVIGRRNHPSLAVWSGGNELHYSPDHLCDDSHPALGALRAVVAQLDPGRHWVSTSPAGGVFPFGVPENEEAARRLQDVHGPWEYQGLRAHYTLYNRGQSLLHSEFGVEGLTNLSALNATISSERQWPVSLENPVWEHLGAWWVKEAVWREVFGPLEDVATVQRATQFLQADGLRYAVEADRRRQYYNGGTMPWQFNEPYPMGACTSAVDYFSTPKPVYYAVARAYAPLTVSAQFDTLAWGSEAAFHAGIWCSNSQAAREGNLVARIIGLRGQVWLDEQHRITCPENGSAQVGEVSLPLDQVRDSVFFLDLDLQNQEGQRIAGNRYVFTRAENLAPLLAVAPASVQTQVAKAGNSWQIHLRNDSGHAALWLWLEEEKVDVRAPGRAYFDDNYFCLLPGEERSVQVDWSGPEERERALRLSGWNITPGRLV